MIDFVVWVSTHNGICSSSFFGWVIGQPYVKAGVQSERLPRKPLFFAKTMLAHILYLRNMDYLNHPDANDFEEEESPIQALEDHIPHFEEVAQAHLRNFTLNGWLFPSCSFLMHHSPHSIFYLSV